MSGILVVGGGQAAASLIAKLRKEGFDGSITLIGEEPVPPYQRPPLSKKYLTGEMERDRLFLRPEAFYAEQDVTLALGHRATALDPAAKTVTAGETYSYDQLALTTGAFPRQLPAAIGGDLPGVYAVRSLADVDAMAHEFEAGRRVLIVGGGYIGLEAAAVAAGRGLQVTLVEASERILQRVAGPETSDYIRNLHTGHGVTIREGTGLARLVGEDRVSAAELADGSTLDVDFVIVGIGILPDIALAEAAGLTIENGIRVDATCRTSDPHIFSAGDCASFPHGDGRLRLESVGNAIDMGEHVAMAMLGMDAAYQAKPWFWSDQYDVTLQIAGLSTGYDQVVTRGNSFWYFRDNRLIAVDAAKEPRSYMMGKRWIESGKSPTPDAIADEAAELKTLHVT